MSEVVTDAECRIGELLEKIPKQSGMRTDLKPIPSNGNKLKTKAEVLKENGISQRQAPSVVSSE